ncbi:hypothetical protein GCM10027568_24880 [Humibacter soli]
MTTWWGVLAVVNAGVTLFGATIYLGTLWVVELFLRPTWSSLTLDSVEVRFTMPIKAATTFFRAAVIPLLVSGLLLVWSSWGNPAATVCAVVALACYVAIALWFQFVMLPINTAVMAGTAATDDELREQIHKWASMNVARFWMAAGYWLASAGFLVTTGQLWEALS